MSESFILESRVLSEEEYQEASEFADNYAASTSFSLMSVEPLTYVLCASFLNRKRAIHFKLAWG